MHSTYERPRSVGLTLWLILLGGILWLLFGVLLALNAHPAFPDDAFIRGTFAALSIAFGCILLVLLYFLRRRNRLAYFCTVGALAAASFAVFFDDIGPVDLLVLGVFAIPLVLLLKDRLWYLLLDLVG